MATDYMLTMVECYPGEIVNCKGDPHFHDNLQFEGTVRSKADLDLKWIAVLQHQVCLQIDKRTGELIAGGFDHNGDHFSLSANAQINWTALNSVRDELTYPYYVSTSDDGEYEIADAAILHTLCMTAMGTAAAHYASGRALKVSINAAINEAAILAIEDTR